MAQRQMNWQLCSWPVRGEFKISRSSLSRIDTVIVSLSEGPHSGRGECRPYARYDETPRSVAAQFSRLKSGIEAGLTRRDLQTALPAGAARNALDCALWDLQAKQTGVPVWQRLGLTEPKRRLTAFTLSLDSPVIMAQAAKEATAYPLLKIKIGDKGGIECARAVLSARPDAKLIIDANEAMNDAGLLQMIRELDGARIALIEQPLPSQMDTPGLLPAAGPVICADESLHTSADLPNMREAGYRAVNVKLDKCGGLTEAVKLMRSAKDMGFTVMAGCMVASSLAMAPMMMLESLADYLDLDGPLLLSDDIKPSVDYDGAYINPPPHLLWG